MEVVASFADWPNVIIIFEDNVSRDDPQHIFK